MNSSNAINFDLVSRLEGVYLERVWHFLPLEYKSNPILANKLPCYEHYFNVGNRTVVDGPPPPKYKCCHNYQHLNFININARLRTFKSWQYKSVVNPELLASAGFFYTGKDDECVCFCCGVALADWKDEDNPFYEHEKHSPFCRYNCYILFGR